MARKRGRGMAACWYGIARTAVVDRAAAWAEIDDGGTAKIVTGVTEIGEGILTVLAQIAAHEIGVQPEDVTIGDNDTARAPEASHAGATPPDLHDRQRGRARLARGAQAAGRCHGRGLGRRSRGDPAPATAKSGPKAPTIASRWARPCSTAKSRGVVPVGSATFGTDTTGLASGRWLRPALAGLCFRLPRWRRSKSIP